MCVCVYVTVCEIVFRALVSTANGLGHLWGVSLSHSSFNVSFCVASWLFANLCMCVCGRKLSISQSGLREIVVHFYVLAKG